MTQRQVLPPASPLTEDDARHLLASGLLKPVHDLGPKRVGLAIGCDPKTVSRARDEVTTLRADSIFNTLLVDPCILQPIMSHFGYFPAKSHGEAANDLLTAAGVVEAMAALVRAVADGNRDHNETLAVAALIRPHLPAMIALVNEADTLRSARA